MKTDYEWANIELDEAETRRFESDEEYHRKVIRRAEDLSDEVQRTVQICNHEGVVLETVSNY